MYDTGCRLGELAGMNLNEIVYDEHGAFTVVDGKTGKRRVRFIHSLPYLSAWIELHPKKDAVKEKTYQAIPLWVSNSCTTKGKRLTTRGINSIIKNTASKTSINKRISAHQFRHARITDLARKGLNEPQLQDIHDSILIYIVNTP